MMWRVGKSRDSVLVFEGDVFVAECETHAGAARIVAAMNAAEAAQDTRGALSYSTEELDAMRSAPARLDADRTAQPKTELLGVVPVSGRDGATGGQPIAYVLHDAAPARKPACPTCGGTRQMPGDLLGSYYVPCPDCEDRR